MPSASSCFLLSFCFRKVVQKIFSDSAENLQELFPSRNKDGARRTPGGGRPQPPDAPQARPTPWPCLGPTWPAPSPPRVTPSPINHSRHKNPKYPIIFSRRRPRPPSSPTLVQEGSAALLGTLSEKGIDTGGFYVTMPSSGVMQE